MDEMLSNRTLIAHDTPTVVTQVVNLSQNP